MFQPLSTSPYQSSPLRPSPIPISPASGSFPSSLGFGPAPTASSSTSHLHGNGTSTTSDNQPTPSPPQTRSLARSSSRRLSSGSLLSFGERGASPFVGSYEASLLSFRFSTTPSPPLEFRLSLGVIGLGPSTPPSLKCPSHLVLPFVAHFFPLVSSPSSSPVIQSSSSFPSGGVGGRAAGLTGSALSTSPQLAVSPSNAPPSTPYLATFSLNAHFLSLPYPELLPAFPGYQIPVKGQLQLLISNPSTGTGIKIFLLPYDCSGMPYGSRMVLRQKSYEVDSRTSPPPPPSAPSTSPARRRNSGSHHQQYHQPREVLRSSVTVHICSPPNNRGPGHPQKYYLHGAVKLIFSPLAPSSTLPSKSKSSGSHSSASSSLPRTRSVVDLGGSSEADSASGADSRFLPYESEPNAEEYEQARKERKRAVFEAMNPAAANSAEDQGMETVRGRVRRSRKSTTVTDSHRRGSGARREGTESTTVADDGAGALTFTKNSMKRAPGGGGSGLAGGAANAGAGGGVGGEGSSSSSISELSRRLKAVEPFR